MLTIFLANGYKVITNALHGTTLEAFWANLSFILAVVISQPIYTSLSDVLGRKIPLNASFILFLVGSIVFSVANSMSILIVGRVLQGLGGGGLDVLGEVILADITSLKERPLYLGLFSIPMAGGAICGPIIGAALAEYATWRWIGWINLPLGVVGFVLAFFFLQLRPIENSFSEKLRSLDWFGMTLFLVGSTLFALPLSWAGAMYPWSSWRTIVPLIIGFTMLVLFGFYESRPAEPVFPYRVFSNRTALATLTGATIHGAAMYAGLPYMLFFFQAVFLETPFRSSIEVLPVCCFIVAFSIFGAVAVEVTRRYRWKTIAAWPFLACGTGLFALWRPDSSDALKYGLQVIAGIGLGTLFTILTFPMQASQHVNDAGFSAGIMVSFRMFGGLIGLSIGSTIFHNIFENRIAGIGPLPPEFGTLMDVREAIGFIPVLRFMNIQDPMTAAVVEAYRVSLSAVFLALAGMGVIGFISSFLIREISLENDDLGRQHFEEASRREK